MLFYGRYTRNEGFIELLGVVLLYGILRYLDRGDRVGLFLVTLATVMHFIVKETAFIYTAQALIFLFFIFLVEVRRANIRLPERYNRFLLAMLLAMVLVFAALGLAVVKADGDHPASTAAPAGPTTETPGSLFDPAHLRLYAEIVLVSGALALAGFGLFSLARDIGWDQLKKLRSFTLLILIGTLILPMLSPLPVSMLGWNPLDYNNTVSMLRTGAFILVFFAISVAIGVWWNPMLWLQHAFLFYAIFVVFYTTFFTNGDGFFTGIVGSLGYWLSQQGVERGSQPLYYYALIQMPVYEFLAYLGTILAVYFGIRYRRFSTMPGFAPAQSPYFTEAPITDAEAEPEQPADAVADAVAEEVEGGARIYRVETTPQVLEADQPAHVYEIERPLPVLGFFLYWAITSLLAYTVAGERMPWLTVHITMGFLLASAWGLGYLIDTTDWKRLARWSGFLVVLLIPVFYAAAASLFGSLLGANPPFQGNTLEQLQSTNRFLLALAATIVSFAGLFYLVRDWQLRQVLRLGVVVFFALMITLTARAAYRASFIFYDYAYEYLVYAHAAPWPKEVLNQIEDISRRTTGGKNIQVGYSSDMLYPYWWYLRSYPNHRWFQTNPTRDLRDFPVIVAGEDVFGKMDSIVGDSFYQYEYMRLWWPNQDYYNLTWDRIRGVITNPAMREAIFQIWLNRDYRKYAQATNQPQVLSAEGWSPAARMRVYIRKDIAAKIWEFGASPVAINPEQADPYSQKLVQLSPAQWVGSTGNQPGQFQAPRGLEVAPDGSVYVADSRNHRIQHLAADGSVLHVWGSFGDINSGNAPGGTFNEPWDVAVGPDGSVYVSDTWNHRVQKFGPDGQFIRMWGYFGQGEAPEAFWGPRGLAVDAEGRLYVMDTGNKRVVIFNADGTFVSQFGQPGFDRGQFDEPVGIALDDQGNAYVTDTWNQRIQVFVPDVNRTYFTPVRSWDFTGWEGQSLDNKPFIAFSPVSGNLLVVDPEKPRVVEFTQQGDVVRAWGDYSATIDGFGMTAGVAVAPNGDVWISDAGNNVLLRFQLTAP